MRVREEGVHEPELGDWMSEVTVVDATAGSSERRRIGPERAVWLLTLVMATSAVAVVLSPWSLDYSISGLPPLEWWGLLVLFAVAEVLVIHLPSVRSAHTHTLREIPALAGIVFLTPGEYVSAFLLGAGLALVLWSGVRGLKLCFNLAMYAMEATVGLSTYVWVLGSADLMSLRSWAAAFVAMLVTVLISSAAVWGAISLTEGRPETAWLKQTLRSALPASLVNTCMALLVIVLVLRAPRALPLMAVILLLLVAAYRTYIALASGYSRLALLHGFIGSSGRETELDAVIDTTLHEAARIMRAGRAVVLLLPVENEAGGGARVELFEEAVRRSRFDVAGEVNAWWAPAMRGESVLLPSDPVQGSPDRPRDGIAVPLQVTGTVDAVLLVTDRTFAAETFTTEDLRLLETLAGHGAVNLDKARLVDRLRRLADERQHEARHDGLTDLPNRLAFREALDDAILRGEGGAVLLLDLDDFKDVNDTLGHDAGDTLLTVTARRLDSEQLGMVARLGGDEFAVLLPGVDMETAVACGRRLARLVAAPTSLAQVHLITSASIGVSRFAGNESTSDELLAQADVAMHTAKSGSRGVEVHSPADTIMVRRRLELAAALPAALRAGEIRAWFQPQSDAIDGTIVGAEALLRWTHPLHGPIPPPEVIALAIRTGVLTQLTATMLDQALHRRAGWAAGGSPMEISVNVAPADLLEGSLPTTVARLLADTGTPANALTIEITESDVMTDPERCLAVLHELAMLGVKVSVDDFGIGHSSLAYLDRLPVHEVKIDRSFVQRIERRASDSTIVRATVALAHDLGLRVVAEGVENDVALERVIAVGCDRIQGFGLARPMSGPVFDAWIYGREREAARL